MSSTTYDLAVIGGGINGVGIAADAAGRGLRVGLFEKGDLASGTSSASTKLIHGGLRYLEHAAFGLVRHALVEREVLLQRAPHLIHPMRFVIPHVDGMRSRFLTRAGLLLYDWLAWRRHIPSSGRVDFSRDPMGRALRADIRSGFYYYDCWVDDARLVIALARDAAGRGADIFTRTPATRLAREGDGWRIETRRGGATSSFFARAAVNAAGPWCADVGRLSAPTVTPPALRLVRGSHIVVPRVSGADDALLLQHSDGRIVFVLPFGTRFTLIGTTEVSVPSPEAGYTVSTEEEAYLLNAANRYLAQRLDARNIVWRFAGVRPLVDDGAKSVSAVTREWRLDLAVENGTAPALTVIGGKITTFRLLAEAVLEQLAPFFPGLGPAWTANAVLPGGDFGADGPAGFLTALSHRYPNFNRSTLERLVGLYGTSAEQVIGDATREEDLGPPIGGGLTSSEIIFLRDTEWARTPEDVLWRRTKAGLELNEAERMHAEDKISRLLTAS